MVSCNGEQSRNCGRDWVNSPIGKLQQLSRNRIQQAALQPFRRHFPPHCWERRRWKWHQSVV